PRHDLEQRGLAGAVRADDADLRAGQKVQRDVVENDLVAVRLPDVAKRVDEFRHTPEPMCSGGPFPNRPSPLAFRGCPQARISSAGRGRDRCIFSVDNPSTEGTIMSFGDTYVTVVGRVGNDPDFKEINQTPQASFRLGSTPRQFDRTINGYVDKPTTWYTV